jgi:Fe-S-cluster-containing hydrogenase component 2
MKGTHLSTLYTFLFRADSCPGNCLPGTRMCTEWTSVCPFMSIRMNQTGATASVYASFPARLAHLLLLPRIIHKVQIGQVTVCPFMSIRMNKTCATASLYASFPARLAHLLLLPRIIHKVQIGQVTVCPFMSIRMNKTCATASLYASFPALTGTPATAPSHHPQSTDWTSVCPFMSIRMNQTGAKASLYASFPAPPSLLTWHTCYCSLASSTKYRLDKCVPLHVNPYEPNWCQSIPLCILPSLTHLLLLPHIIGTSTMSGISQESPRAPSSR